MGEAQKDTVVTLEINGIQQSEMGGSSNEFTDCAHLRQVMCLLPVDCPPEIEDKESSDDSIDEKIAKKKGNLELSKKLDVYIRVSKFV